MTTIRSIRRNMVLASLPSGTNHMQRMYAFWKRCMACGCGGWYASGTATRYPSHLTR